MNYFLLLQNCFSIVFFKKYHNVQIIFMVLLYIHLFFQIGISFLLIFILHIFVEYYNKKYKVLHISYMIFFFHSPNMERYVIHRSSCNTTIVSSTPSALRAIKSKKHSINVQNVQNKSSTVSFYSVCVLFLIYSCSLFFSIR